jgi:4-hydroxy-tetrahydrodipicolinate synthase
MAIKQGIYSASMSIFTKDLFLDIESTIDHAEKLLKNGCHGVAIFGSTGQSQLISTNEKKN